MGSVTLAEVADELYSLPPAEFVAARDEQARIARAAGQRDVAAAIKKLTRPTASAWLVNRLARDEPEQMNRLFEVGEAMQEAQRTLAGDRIRELSGERREAINDLLPAATSLALQAKQPASQAVLGEVRATLEAALADPQAREAVRSGRLTRALAYAGLGEVDLSAALALPVTPDKSKKASAEPKKKTSAKAKKQPAAAEPVPEPEARRSVGAGAAPDDGRRAAAEAVTALREAEAAAQESEAVLAAAQRLASSLAEQRQFMARRLVHLTRELERAQVEDDRLAGEEAEAKRRLDAATVDRDEARQVLDRARRRAARA